MVRDSWCGATLVVAEQIKMRLQLCGVISDSKKVTPYINILLDINPDCARVGDAMTQNTQEDRMLHEKNQAIMMLDSKPSEVVRYAWPGGYPVFYVTNDGGALCPGCVQDELEQCCDPDAHGWHVVAHDANWENPDLYCDHCSERIESAYAEQD